MRGNVARFFSRFSTSAMVAMLTAGVLFVPVGGGVVHAQQATGKAQPKQLNQAPTPVTPFGPRRKPPRGGMPGAAPQMPRPEVVAEYGIWRVLCEKVPVAVKDGKPQLKKTCYVSATQVDPKRQGLFISLVILKVKDDKGKVKGHMISLRAPIGVFLPTGIAMEIDGKPVARAPFTRCNPVFCESTNQARKETLARLKKGKKAKFIVYAAPGVGLPVEMELKGFSAAIKKMAELP